MLAGNLRLGDWTVDGVVHVTSIDVSDRRLTIHADRLTLIYDGHALAFQTSGNKKPKRTSRLRIETELDAGAVTAEKGQALLAKIFLTPPDRLADIVPDYWKSCVLAASENLGKDRYTGGRPRRFGIRARPRHGNENRGRTARSHREGSHSSSGEVSSKPSVFNRSA